MTLTKNEPKDFQECIAQDLGFIEKLWCCYQSTPTTQTNIRQSFVNILLRTLLLHCHAKETAIFPLYRDYNDGGESILTSGKVQYEHLRAQIREMMGLTVTDHTLDDKLSKVLKEFFAYSEQEMRYHLPYTKERMKPEEVSEAMHEYEKNKKTTLDDATLVRGDTQTILERVLRDHLEITRNMNMAENAIDMTDKRKYMQRAIRALAIHAYCEETGLYPVYEKNAILGREAADGARKEHLNMKTLMANIEAAKDDHEFLENMRLLKQQFEEHKRDEEHRDLPLLMKNMRMEDAIEIGKNFDKNRSLAPTHPHPSAPDKGGMAQKIVGALAVPIDATRDLLKGEE
ncbi:hypothetical protein HDU96_010159 [Phlyctochytrium bullatum]|nr:hypothetical protein HDU96_010159 [Phlyctochytrium bullatum]